jgi:hypothetical protein
VRNTSRFIKIVMPGEEPRIRFRIRACATGALVVLGSTLVLSSVAQAGTWYLMDPDLKVVSNAGAADRLYQGSRIGPIELTSQGEFSSRDACEPARAKLINDWRKHSPIKRGSWDKYGITTISSFIRCVPDTDPHLTKSAGKESPTLEVYLKNRRGP